MEGCNIGILGILDINAKSDKMSRISKKEKITFRIKRLSINIWEFDNFSLVDFGFEIENKSREPIKILELEFSFKIEKIVDITQECYLVPDMTRIIFARNVEIIDNEQMIADGIFSKITPIDKIEKPDSVQIRLSGRHKTQRVVLLLKKAINNGEVGAFRIRLKTKDIPLKYYVFPFILYKKIFDIRLFSKRAVLKDQNRIEYEKKMIDKLYIFVMPKKQSISLSAVIGPTYKPGARLLEEDWVNYLNIKSSDLDIKISKGNILGRSVYKVSKNLTEENDKYLNKIQKYLKKSNKLNENGKKRKKCGRKKDELPRHPIIRAYLEFYEFDKRAIYILFGVVLIIILKIVYDIYLYFISASKMLQLIIAFIGGAAGLITVFSFLKPYIEKFRIKLGGENL
ncbi:MAG: hypothetical protein H0Z18_08545 [Thermococcus sp.]|uniref:hypothetical protein n=1 Tax=Thermococcus sp. TaxID=35749 RepID=UPI001D1D3C48|nr:hypothetical protein [Thermococcus sp.]MBO8175293.1 hypothetical protein [Thermococcus sp.]